MVNMEDRGGEEGDQQEANYYESKIISENWLENRLEKVTVYPSNLRPISHPESRVCAESQISKVLFIYYQYLETCRLSLNISDPHVKSSLWSLHAKKPWCLS